jgi:hypothetical protein
MGWVKTFVPTSGNFHDGGNWSPSGVPGPSDRIVIGTGQVCTVTADATVDTLFISADDGGGGQLVIQAGITLTLENNNDNVAGSPDNSIVDGQILLEGSSISGAALFIKVASHTISGVGEIYGQWESCEIKIEDMLTLTNQLSTLGMRGAFTIQGYSVSNIPQPGNFVNDGIVEVHHPSLTSFARVILGNFVTVDDTQAALWYVHACKGSMVFRYQSLFLEGDFLNDSVAPGSFVFEQSVKTCGTYTRNAGGITFSANKYFKYAAFGGGLSGCGNPGSVSGSPRASSSQI